VQEFCVVTANDIDEIDEGDDEKINDLSNNKIEASYIKEFRRLVLESPGVNAYRSSINKRRTRPKTNIVVVIIFVVANAGLLLSSLLLHIVNKECSYKFFLY